MPHSLHRRADVGLDEPYTQPSDRRTLTDVEVAARLGVSRFTVRSWRLKGVGPRFMKMGRAVRYRPQETNTNGRLSSTRRQDPITPPCDRACAKTPLARRPSIHLTRRL
jgi:predicted DNA-binding transcriptional regulator AlpA